MYQVVITPSAKKSAKKLPKAVRERIIKISSELKHQPFLGEKLSGSLHFLYSLHFKIREKDYRIAYSIDKRKGLIIIHLAQIREGFYQRLKRLFC